MKQHWILFDSIKILQNSFLPLWRGVTVTFQKFEKCLSVWWALMGSNFQLVRRTYEFLMNRFLFPQNIWADRLTYRRLARDRPSQTVPPPPPTSGTGGAGRRTAWDVPGSAPASAVRFIHFLNFLDLKSDANKKASKKCTCMCKSFWRSKIVRTCVIIHDIYKLFPALQMFSLMYTPCIRSGTH